MCRPLLSAVLLSQRAGQPHRPLADSRVSRRGGAAQLLARTAEWKLSCKFRQCTPRRSSPHLAPICLNASDIAIDVIAALFRRSGSSWA